MKDNKITYTDYIEIFNEIEHIEQIATPPKYRRCCYNLLELMKTIIQYFKIKSNKCKSAKRVKKATTFILIKAVSVVIYVVVVEKHFIRKLKQQPIRKAIQW